MINAKSDRPYVICHMATTIDGKIQANNWHGFSVVHELYEKCHKSFKGDAWIVGRTTMESYTSAKGKTLKKSNRKIPKTDYVGDYEAKRFAIVVDSSGKCHWNSNSITGDHVIEILTKKVSVAYLEHLQSMGVSYIFAGRSEVDLSLALKKLKKIFSIEKLLLEGGGIINGSFLKAGFIDEISQLVVPLADGSIGTPTLFDVENGYTSRKATRLKLYSLKKFAGDVIWIRYKI